MSEVVVDVAGRPVRLSSLDRPIWPGLMTKSELLDYYVTVAPALLPHVAGRPMTLHRFPEGVGGPHFFQTRTPPRPPWVRTVTLHFPRTGKIFDTPVLDDLPSLVWAVNLTTVEFHPFLGCADTPDQPTALVFDLDPGAPAGLLDACRVALAVRDLLADVGLRCYAKTSGGKGVHVYVPVAGATYDDTKAYARGVARALTRAHPDRVVDVMTRSKRPGKVFVDWSQNDMGKSTVAAYSVRATPRPRVSLPVTWEEVGEAVATGDHRQLVASPAQALTRLERHGDLFAATLGPGHRLPSPGH